MSAMNDDCASGSKTTTAMSTSNDRNVNSSKPKITMEWDHEKGIPTGDVYVQYPNESKPCKVPRTEEEIDRAFGKYVPPPMDKTPYPQSTLDLYHKAIHAPYSITEEERCLILHWVSEDVVDERCRNRCGISWKDLITKAIERPGELTCDEAQFVSHGRCDDYENLDAGLARLGNSIAQTEEVRELR